MSVTTSDNVTFERNGMLYAFSPSNDDKVVCGGCGRELKNFRGLMSHQNHRNAAPGCQPVSVVKPEAEVQMIDGRVATAEEVAELDAVDAEPYSDARLRASMAEHFEEYAEAVFAVGEDDEDEVADEPVNVVEVRDQLIEGARRYARVPAFPTMLVHLIGVTDTAWRWHPEDATRLIVDADESEVVKITNHADGSRTVVTHLAWMDGLKAVVTEKQQD